MSPLIGPVFYLIAGINRIRHDHMSEQRNKDLKDYAAIPEPPVADIGAIAGEQFSSLRVLGDRISHFPLRDGNHIQMLLGGDQAYPAMIAAIDGATQSIALQIGSASGRERVCKNV